MIEQSSSVTTPKPVVTLDSGERQEFLTGARRDSQESKSAFHLVPTHPLRRLADLYARGAIKYGLGNWQKGMPYSRVYASMFRHMIQFAEGDTVEDHLAAVAWNAFTLMQYQKMIKEGKLDSELDDMTEEGNS